jgi:hypothetical protein
MKRKIRATIVVTAILIAAMPVIAFKCSDDQLQRFDRAMGHVINGLNAGSRDIIPALVAEGTLQQLEADRIAPLLLEAKRVAEEARTTARGFKNFDAPARERIAQAVREISASLTRLNNEGVLHIKNEKAQRRLSLGLSLANLAAITLATELGVEEQPAETKPE